jgi:hypothetical protein
MSGSRTLTSNENRFRIDYFYQLNHRRLRERYRLASIERHERWVMRALEKRHVK